MSVRTRFEDLNLALKIVEELRSQDAAANGLDSYLLVSFLRVVSVSSSHEQ